MLINLRRTSATVAGTAVLVGVMAGMPALGMEASGGALQRAHVDVGNVASLQRGARNFVNYCYGCHSAKYVRYNRMAEDLDLSEQQVTDNLMFTGERPFDTLQNAMRTEDARRWFGNPPPDLSLIARSRTPDYVYSFLKSFYVDPSRPTGTNNMMLPGAAMPHVLWEQQGLQRAVYEGEADEAGNIHRTFTGFEPVTEGALSPEAYDQFVRDTVNFLAYISEPVQLERRNLGIRVLGFLLVFLLFAYFLKKEIWKDVR